MKPDFRQIIADTRQYNFHCHTQYCDGRSSIADFAEEATRRGMLHLGFSPHSPIPIASSCNMSEADVELYMADVDRARSLYGDSVKFYTGMEIDYLGPMWGPSHPYFLGLGLDYSIGSVHFIPSQEGALIDIDGNFERFRRNMEEHFRGDIRYVVDSFFTNSLDMIAAGGFDILGHFDKIARNASLWQEGIEDEPWYQAWIDRMFEAIAASDLIVEVNTKSYQSQGRLFPALRHMRRLVDSGATILVNSDSHESRLIEASREYAFGIIDGILL